MNIWNTIKLCLKFTFGGFECATDYLVKILCSELDKSESVTKNILRLYATIEKVLGYMLKYQDFCPRIWEEDYQKLIDALRALRNAFADGKVTADEAKKAIDVFKAAVLVWMED